MTKSPISSLPFSSEDEDNPINMSRRFTVYGLNRAIFQMDSYPDCRCYIKNNKASFTLASNGARLEDFMHCMYWTDNVIVS